MTQVKIFKSNIDSMDALQREVNEFLKVLDNNKFVTMETKIVQGFGAGTYGSHGSYVIIVIEYNL